VTVQFLVEIPTAEDYDDVAAEITSEIEHAIQGLRLAYTTPEIRCAPTPGQAALFTADHMADLERDSGFSAWEQARETGAPRP
jgi:hypothetical protein